ncbi:putative tyrosine-protein kinase [Apostichopus japonicus]|uniref:Putative tyrosine-protein kinase n=1 Tax=Stichopus japonicus TaxID=307972 RepID=A0A2G8KSH6_STIJA|nr:putative tyrosine-protein kinase [Apostichopus japonicus]
MRQNREQFNTQFHVGEVVELAKCKGKIVKGKIVQVKSEPNQTCNGSPSSDKENHSIEPELLRKSKSNKNKPLYYNIQIGGKTGKVISSVPASDLIRCEDVPAPEFISLLIRSNALQAGTKSNSTWVVTPDVVKALDIRNKLIETMLPSTRISIRGLKGAAKRKPTVTSPNAQAIKKPKVENGCNADLADGEKTPPKRDSNPVVIVDTDSEEYQDASSVSPSPEKVPWITATVLLKPRPKGRPARPQRRHPASVVHSQKNLQRGEKRKRKSGQKEAFDTDGQTRQGIPAKVSKTEGKSVPLKKSPAKLSPKKGLTTPKNSPSKKSVSLATLARSLKSSPKKKLSDGARGKTNSPAKSRTPVKSQKGKGKSPTKVSKTSPKKTPVVKKTPLKQRKLSLKASKSKKKTQPEYNSSDDDALILYKIAKPTPPFTPREPPIAAKQKMTPEEKKKILEAKRGERKKKREAEKKKKLEEEKEKAKRYEDQVLDLKPLIVPKPVPLPEGLPNTLFGDIAMVVEFLNCYSGFLMPNDPYPVTTDSFMKALVCDKEGFAYLSRMMVILLKTLLQDQITEDFVELGMKLSDIPVNMHTASELLRLSLLQADTDTLESKDYESDTSSITQEEGEFTAPQDLVELLETSEFFSLSPEEKLELMVCVCNRILSTYSLVDYMEDKQRKAAKLWCQKMQTLKLKNDQKREEKKRLREVREAAQKQRKEEEEKKKAEKETNGSKPEVKKPAKKKAKKEETKKETPAVVEEPEDLPYC